MVIVGIFFTIRSSVRTRKQIEKGQTNWGLALVLIGLTVIALHYIASLAALYVLPHFLSVSDTWTIMRSLRLNGSWFIIGSGLLCLAWGLHLVFRDIRVLARRLHGTEESIENQANFR